MYVGDIAVFEDNTEQGELRVQVRYHLTRHFTLKIEHLGKPDAVNEVTNTLINFRVEKLIKTTCT